MQGLDFIEVAVSYVTVNCLVNCLYGSADLVPIFVYSSFIDRVSEVMEDTDGTEQQYEWSREGEQVGALFISF
jgi:hypothetical protein